MPSRREPRLIIQACCFLAFFVLLHAGWTAARGTQFERIVIDVATVRTSVVLINVIAPQSGASADGTRIRAPGGGINILNGCEGTDALFLLVAAILASPASWRFRTRGVAIGTLIIFAANQFRILILFYANRHDRGLFDLLHGTVLPIGLIAAASLYFLVWSSCPHDVPPDDDASAAS